MRAFSGAAANAPVPADEGAQLERTVTVRTPESIAFHYELAGLGSRFLAVIIDFVIQVVVLLVLLLVVGLISDRVAPTANALHLNSVQARAVVAAFFGIVAFLLFFGYFIMFESVWNGQTPGKRLLGIRVVRDGGYPLDFGSTLLRNIIRVVEALLLYIPSAVSALVSSQNKRLGDLAAGTIVVRDRAFEVTDPQSWMRGDAVPTGPPLVTATALTSDEWALVDRYIERRTSLPPSVAAATAARIASALRPKLGEAGAGLTDDDLLLRLFASQRA
jgi:uncharacterized RDD family membrane protein YckC